MAAIDMGSLHSSLDPLDNMKELPSLADDDELWEVFIELALEHRSKISKSLDDTLNTLMLFVSHAPWCSHKIMTLVRRYRLLYSQP